MQETPAERAQLDALLESSRARATEHLQSIISDDRALNARQITRLLSGMKVLALATVSAKGAPRISAVDGHFLHGAWIFTTDPASAKASHLDHCSAVSAAHIDHERCAVFCHGEASRLRPEVTHYRSAVEHLSRHYGVSPDSWGEDTNLYRIEPTWMVGFAADPRLFAELGLED